MSADKLAAAMELAKRDLKRATDPVPQKKSPKGKAARRIRIVNSNEYNERQRQDRKKIAEDKKVTSTLV